MLDKDKLYHNVTGNTGVRFQQGDKLFLANGLECDVNGKLIEADEKALKAEADAVAKVEAETAKKKKIADAKLAKEEKARKKAVDDAPVKPEPVDTKSSLSSFND